MPADSNNELIVFGLNSCDTCRKAQRWLEEHGLTFTFVDVRADGLRVDTVRRWLRSPFEPQLLNRRSTTWRQLTPSEQDLAESDPVGLIREYPLLVRRPVFMRGKTVLGVGFDPRDLRQRLLS